MSKLEGAADDIVPDIVVSIKGEVDRRMLTYFIGVVQARLLKIPWNKIVKL